MLSPDSYTRPWLNPWGISSLPSLPLTGPFHGISIILPSIPQTLEFEDGGEDLRRRIRTSLTVGLGDAVLWELRGHPGRLLPDWLSGTRLHLLMARMPPFKAASFSFPVSLSPAAPDSRCSSSSPSTSAPFSEHHTEVLQTSSFFSLPCSLVAQMGKKKSACNEGDPGDPGSIPELGRSPGEGNGNPLQYSGLENSMDRGAWGATVHGVTKSETWLSDYTFFQTIFKSQNHFLSEEIHFYFILQSSLVSLILTSLF